MSVVDLGNQHRIFRYKSEATGEEFTKLGRGFIQPGIYSGGFVTNSGNDLSVAPFNCVFNVDTNKITQVTTSSSVTQTITYPNDIFYMTYSYDAVENNYADFGFSYSKETYLFTNFLLPFSAIKVSSASPGLKTIRSSYERSKVPAALIEKIIQYL